MHFFSKKFAYIKKLLYLCTRFKKSIFETLKILIVKSYANVHKCVFNILMIMYISQINLFIN